MTDCRRQCVWRAEVRAESTTVRSAGRTGEKRRRKNETRSGMDERGIHSCSSWECRSSASPGNSSPRGARRPTAYGNGSGRPAGGLRQPHSFIQISDPVAETSYVLEPEQKIARQMHGPIGLSVRTKGGPGGGSGNVFYKTFKEAEQAEAKTESLGLQTVGGVNAEGTRTTRTIPAGEIGNEKPITVVSERWYSADIQMDVKSPHSDPRFGNTTYTLTNIQRAEPAATLFAVPAGYTIEQGHRGKFAMNPPPPPPPDN